MPASSICAGRVHIEAGFVARVGLEHDFRFTHRRDRFDESIGWNHDRARSVDRHGTMDDASGGELQIGRLDGHITIRGLQTHAGEHGESRSGGNCWEHRLQFGGEWLCRHHQLHVNLLRGSRERRSP